jgi:hypothetical protein
MKTRSRVWWRQKSFSSRLAEFEALLPDAGFAQTLFYEVGQVFGDELAVSHDGAEQPVDGLALPSPNNHWTTWSATGSAAKRA